MTTAQQFLMTRPFGPSQHIHMRLDERITLYRRVIGTLRLITKPQTTARNRFEVRSATGEAMLITGIDKADALIQIALLTPILEECLDRRAAV